MMRFCSIFNQLLQLFPRVEFQQAVVTTKAERHARGCTCWGQFVAMLFCQLSKAHSLREIAGGLASCEGRLAHLGITAPQPVDAGVCQRPSPLEVVSGGLLSPAGALSGGRPAPQVSLQAQAAQPGCDDH